MEKNPASGNTFELCEVSEAVQVRKGFWRYSIEIQAFKAANQEKRRTKSVALLAASAKRKSDMIEKKNGIAVFDTKNEGLGEHKDSSRS